MINIIIYKILKTKKNNGFLGGEDEDVINYWTLTPPVDAKVVPFGKDEKYNIKYAIENDTDKMHLIKH